MLNPDATVVAKLNEIGLKVYHINSIDLQKAASPCITWQQYDNYIDTQARTLGGYSKIIYKIRIWATDGSTMNNYSTQIDAKMRDLGFERSNIIEEWRTNLGYREIKYQNLYLEYYN